MNHPNSPQAEQMADESMVRNLAAQAEAIWPQEEPIFLRHPPPRGGRVLDVGCGTGEISLRLSNLFPETTLTGVDVEEPHLDRARRKCAALGQRVSFARDDAMHLSQPDHAYDLVVSRHVLQALPDPAVAMRELVRVLKPGGRLHVLAEDYGMLWCHPTPSGSDGFWQRYPSLYGKAVGCDVHVGRKGFALLADNGIQDIRVDYVVVDTVRVPRDLFARIWEAWRDGYTEAISKAGVSRAEVERRWNEMITCVREPGGYALWQVPVWTGLKPVA